MRPLLLADWRAIHRRFCVLVWLVALVLAMVILLHVVRSPSACASRSAAPGSSVCTKSKQAHLAPAKPFLATADATRP
jgi:hypothetical protein